MPIENQHDKMNEKILTVNNLSVQFPVNGGETLKAVGGISFSVSKQSVVGIVGESGSGKTVTALSVMGLLGRRARIDHGGSIVFRGRNLLELGEQELSALRGTGISMIFQEPAAFLNPVFSVGDQLGEVLRLHLKMARKEAKERASELLHEVGIRYPTEKLGAYPHEMSGGQQQRVMIAMAIACNPELLIADEPTTALDTTTQKHILELLMGLKEKHATSLLFISHDLDVVGDIADFVMVMKDGKLVEQGTVAEVFSAPQSEYTQALLACRPRIGWKPRRLPVVGKLLVGDTEPTQAGHKLEAKDPGEVILEARNLSKSFASRARSFNKEIQHVVKNVSFTLRRGQTVGVVGESGSGKTTIARMLPFLITPDEGEVLFEGRSVRELSQGKLRQLRRKVQMIFQDPYGSLNPEWTIGRSLTEPLVLHGMGATAEERLKMARKLLKRVGLHPDTMQKFPAELSGGQRQRVAIARAISMKPEVLICDECVSALDVSVQAQILNLLKELQEEYQICYLFISHDLAVVTYMSDEVLVLRQGEIVERNSAEGIGSEATEPYTRGLFAALPGIWREARSGDVINQSQKM